MLLRHDSTLPGGHSKAGHGRQWHDIVDARWPSGALALSRRLRTGLTGLPERGRANQDNDTFAALPRMPLPDGVYVFTTRFTGTRRKSLRPCRRRDASVGNCKV